jgi:hypothetical protein
LGIVWQKEEIHSFSSLLVVRPSSVILCQLVGNPKAIVSIDRWVYRWTVDFTVGIEMEVAISAQHYEVQQVPVEAVSLIDYKVSHDVLYPWGSSSQPGGRLTPG